MDVGGSIGSGVSPSVKNFDTLNKKKFNILVVDDDEDALELFVELLKTVPNYEVQGAKDGHDCLVKCEESEFDLVLLDIVMPKLDGIDTLAELKSNPEKYKNPTVVMLTNLEGDIAIQECMRIGAHGYKKKIDTEPEELLRYVENTLNARSMAKS